MAMAKRDLVVLSKDVWSRYGRHYLSSNAGSSGRKAMLSRPMIPGVDSIIAVASGKGGVGKSTTAVNLAVALAMECRLRVGLLDADVYGPSIPNLMKLDGRPELDSESGFATLDDSILDLIWKRFDSFSLLPDESHCAVLASKMIPLENYGVRCMSMGFLMEKDAPAVWRGLMVMSALEKLVRGTAWGKLDVLVVDMPPGTGDAQISISQRLPLAGAVIVSTPQDIALIDARRGANMFGKVDVPILGLIENMSYFKCPSCGERSDVFGHGGARATAEEMGMDFLGEVPLNIEIRQTSDAGSPIVASAPSSEASTVYRGIAMTIAAKLKDWVASNVGAGLRRRVE